MIKPDTISLSYIDGETLWHEGDSPDAATQAEDTEKYIKQRRIIEAIDKHAGTHSALKIKVDLGIIPRSTQ